MAISAINREKLIGFSPKVVVEDESSYISRQEAERDYFVRRLTLAQEVVLEYYRSETIRMYEDAFGDLVQFDKIPFLRKRWINIFGIKIPLSSEIDNRSNI